MTPSALRRKGRIAYVPGEDPQVECPYLGDHFAREHWIEGWHQARIADEAEQREKEEIQGRWQDLADECPWENGGHCDAIHTDEREEFCSKENCAPWHFMKEG